MDESSWERLGAATGIVFVIVGIVATAIVKAPPKASASADAVKSYYVANHSRLVLQAFLFGTAFALLLWFGATLRAVLFRAEGGQGRLSTLWFGGLVAAVAVTYAAGSIFVALAFRVAQDLGAAQVRALNDAQNLAMSFGAGFPGAVALAAASLVMVRHGAVSKALGWLGFAVAILTVLGVFAIFTKTGALAFGGVLTMIGFLVFFLWALLVSATLVLRRGARTT